MVTSKVEMIEAAFIDASVVMQIGEFSGPIAQSDVALLRALHGSSGSALAVLPGGVDVVRLEAGALHSVAPERLARWGKGENALAQIRAEAPDFGFIVDMQDRRARRLAEPDASRWPVFCFNRRTSDDQRILWPLPRYHDLDGDQFLADVRPDAVPWQEKMPRVVWRGATVGRVMGPKPDQEGPRLRAIFRRYANGRISDAGLAKQLARLPRFNALTLVQGDPRFDFGFVDGGGFIIADTPHHAPFARPRMAHLDMQRYKYIAVLRGVDVGSSFYWVMNSGSVGFVMDTPYETFASAHFRPWEHYIPVREDCADLVARFDWAEAHPDECREMTQRAAAVCQFLARADLRAKILHGVVRKVESFIRR